MIEVLYLWIYYLLILIIKNDTKNEEFLLFEFYRLILENNKKNIILITKKNIEVFIFKIRNIIFLLILLKTRFSGETICFFYCIIKIIKKIYILLS